MIGASDELTVRVPTPPVVMVAAETVGMATVKNMPVDKSNDASFIECESTIFAILLYNETLF
jgi:hypothetical protein